MILQRRDDTDEIETLLVRTVERSPDLLEARLALARLRMSEGKWEEARALLSPALYERYIQPAVSRIVSRFDTTIMHLHPSDFIPARFLLRTDLSAIELHIDLGGPRAANLLPVHREIMEEKPLIIWGDLTREDLAFIRANLDPCALCLIPVVSSPREAAEIWKLMKA